MARTPTRLWHGSRRATLRAVEYRLQLLLNDQSREQRKAEQGQTPLYLYPPGDPKWEQVQQIINDVRDAVIAVG